MPPTAPSTMFRIPGRIPANDLNTNQIGNYMRSVYHNLAMTHGANVMSAKLKQKVAYRDILGRESLLRRRQEQLSNLSDQIAQYYGEFGSVLNDRALDFLNKQASINVPTFTSILAGFENARASRADMEQKRLKEFERLMNLDAGLQQERMALRKEQMDAQNMVAQAALDAQSKISAGQINAANTGLNALSHSGTGVTFEGGNYVSAPYQQQPRIPGLGGSAGAKAAAQAELLRRDIASSKQATTTETPAEKATGTPAQKSEPMKDDVTGEIFPTQNEFANRLKSNTAAIASYVREGKPGFSGNKFQEYLSDLRTYFKANPDKLQIMEEYVPGFSERLNSDTITPEQLSADIRDAWDGSAKARRAAAFRDLPTQDTTKATTTPTTQPGVQTATGEFMSGVNKGVDQVIEALPAGLIPGYTAIKAGVDLYNRFRRGNSAQQDKKETSSIIDVFSPTAVHAAESTPMTSEQIALANAGGVPREGMGGETVLQDADARAMSKNTNGVPTNQTVGQNSRQEAWEEYLRRNQEETQRYNQEMRERKRREELIRRYGPYANLEEVNYGDIDSQAESNEETPFGRFVNWMRGTPQAVSMPEVPQNQFPEGTPQAVSMPEVPQNQFPEGTPQAVSMPEVPYSPLARSSGPNSYLTGEFSPTPTLAEEAMRGASARMAASDPRSEYEKIQDAGRLPSQSGRWDMSFGDPDLPLNGSVTQDDLFRMAGEDPSISRLGTSTPQDTGELYPRKKVLSISSDELGMKERRGNLYSVSILLQECTQELFSHPKPLNLTHP